MAVGMITLATTGILPVLTPAAAGGLAVIMVGAAFTHLFRAEYVQILPPLTLLVLALFVAYGRVKVHPFTAPSLAEEPRGGTMRRSGQGRLVPARRSGHDRHGLGEYQRCRQLRAGGGTLAEHLAVA